jgi:hypothetical protein
MESHGELLPRWRVKVNVGGRVAVIELPFDWVVLKKANRVVMVLVKWT